MAFPSDIAYPFGYGKDGEPGVLQPLQIFRARR